MNSRHLAYLTLVLAICFAAAPLVTSPFTGFTADQLPNYQPDPVIQPAGWAFSIWGVIYLWLVLGSVYGAIRASDHPHWDDMRKPLAVSLLLGVFWLWAANTSPILATVMILVMAGTAIMATLRARDEDRLWRRGPVGLYAGWLTAASAVSVSIVLPGYGLVAPLTAGVVALLVALGVALWVQARSPDALSYAVAVCWALAGIFIDQWNGGNVLVLGLAAIGFIMIALRALFAARS